MYIRYKELEDCESWVDINISGWHDNLKGIISDKLLQFMTDNRDARIQKDIDNFQINEWKYVIEDQGQVVGIMKLRSSEKVGYENFGEVQMLYVKTSEKGKGYGKALLDKAFADFRKKGYKKVVIGCLKGNHSNGFYQHLGGKLVKVEPWEIQGECYQENIYEYDL